MTKEGLCYVITFFNARPKFNICMRTILLGFQIPHAKFIFILQSAQLIFIASKIAYCSINYVYYNFLAITETK